MAAWCSGIGDETARDTRPHVDLYDFHLRKYQTCVILGA